MKWLAERLVVLSGWTFEGTQPRIRKAVLIGAPHTSNWDFIIFLAAIHHFDLRVKFLVKEGLMVWPLSWFMVRWGAIPVPDNPDGDHHLTDTVIKSFSDHEDMMLVMAPEGTRALADRWRSGFWRIAEAADVPVMMSFLDAKTKRTGIGPTLMIEGDPEAFMSKAQAFYADKRGIKPQNEGPIRL